DARAASAERDQIGVVLGRRGQRPARAAERATAAGFTQAYNVRDGFEGPLDQSGRRGARSGWRFVGLPWEQE
ncbi:MAG: rhodanese-like domain-containing protein, partial [Burkholderiales bacterium]